MALFSILCTTCHRQLKVTDASAIGQILACPGCGAMVQVEAPPEWSAGERKLTPNANQVAANRPSSVPRSTASPSASSPSARPQPPSRKQLPQATPLSETFDDAASLLGEEPPPSSDRSGVFQPASSESQSITTTASGSGMSDPVDDLADTVEDLSLADTESNRSGDLRAQVSNVDDRPASSADLSHGASSAVASGFRPPVSPVPTKVASRKPPQLPRAEAVAEPVSSKTLSPQTDAPVLPSEQWTSDSTRRIRKWSLIGIAGGSCVAVVCVLVALLISQVFDPPVSTEGIAQGSESKASSTGASSTGASSTGVGLTGAGSSPSSKTANRPPEAPSHERNQQSPTVDDLAPPLSSIKVIGGGNEPSETSDGSPNPQASGQNLVASGNPQAPSAADLSSGRAAPIGFEPEGAAAPDPAPGKPSGAASPGSARPQLVEDMGRFAPLLENDAFDPENLDAPITDESSDAEEPEAVAEKTEDSTADGVETDAAESDAPHEGPGLPTRPEPRNVDVAARSDDEFRGIEFLDAPLVDFLRFVSDISTIPITLDPQALTRRDLTPNVSVNVKAADASVSRMLSQALTPLGLTFVRSKHGIRVVSNGDQITAHAKYPVGDLLVQGFTKTMLVEWTQALVAPASWKKQGGAGLLVINGSQLAVTQTPPVQHQVEVLLEQLRLARGLKPRRLSVEHVSLDPPREDVSPRLAKRLTLNYVTPTRFLKIVRQIETNAEVRLLIDWSSLAIDRWNPEAQTTLTVEKRTLAETLLELLHPMELTYRPIDETTFQIYSPKTEHTLWSPRFYDLKTYGLSSIDAAQLQQKIRQALADAGFDEAASHAAVRRDAPSGYLVATLPHSGHEALAGALAEVKR